MLSQRELVSYLLDGGWVRAEEVVDERFTITEVPRRNRNFKVNLRRRPGYFVKQASRPSRASALTHEASMYGGLDQVGDPARFDRYLPRLLEYDRRNALLVLELLPDACTLRQYHARTGRFSVTLASQLGKALARLHGLPFDRFMNRPRSAVPWTLSIGEPDLDFVLDFSSASVQLLEIVQQSEELCSLLQRLRPHWRHDAITHQDLRWDNCLAFGVRRGARRTRLKIVDWELAGGGDPCWDVGSALCEYLSFWLLSIPSAEDIPSGRWPHLARHPLERMQPAIRAFWRSYWSHSALRRVAPAAYLERSMSYAAARLVQAAFEQTQMAPRLTPFAVIAVQTALNVLKQPRQAAAQLFTLSCSETARA